ncbi:MAG TPA: hypothetical protein VGD27_09895 [Longimicrobiales bacterium]
MAADFEALKPFPSADPPGRAEQPRPDPAPEPARTLEPSNLPGLVAPGGRFLVMAGLQLERSNQEVHCRVELRRGTASFQGEAREMDTPTGRARAAARATLAAAEYACPGITLGLEGVAIVDLFSRRYVAASVEAAQARNYALLAGLVTLENNRAVEDAAVLATLRAIDRWLAQ